MQAVECHLITIKNDFQSYSWRKDIIIAVKLIAKARKNKKIQQKHKIDAPFHREELTGPQLLQGDCWERGGDVFQGEGGGGVVFK